MSKNKLLLSALLAIAPVAQASSLDAYYASLNLGLGFKNKMPASGSSFANIPLLVNEMYKESPEASEKNKTVDFKNKVGFAGDIRFGRDWQLGHSCAFLGVFLGFGMGGGSNKAEGKVTVAAGEGSAVAVPYKMSVTQKMYVPLGMRVGYSVCGTKVFLNLGYAPQKVEFSSNLGAGDDSSDKKSKFSKTAGSFLVGVGFSTPVSQNMSLGLSAETFISKMKLPQKLQTQLRTLATGIEETFDANAKKASSYVQTRILVSFTYVMPTCR
jgi:opacity protein-like surface antigen